MMIGLDMNLGIILVLTIIVGLVKVIMMEYKVYQICLRYKGLHSMLAYNPENNKYERYCSANEVSRFGIATDIKMCPNINLERTIMRVYPTNDGNLFYERYICDYVSNNKKGE